MTHIRLFIQDNEKLDFTRPFQFHKQFNRNVSRSQNFDKRIKQETTQQDQCR